jgi:hypothetical protein
LIYRDITQCIKITSLADIITKRKVQDILRDNSHIIDKISSYTICKFEIDNNFIKFGDKKVQPINIIGSIKYVIY